MHHVIVKDMARNRQILGFQAEVIEWAHLLVEQLVVHRLSPVLGLQHIGVLVRDLDRDALERRAVQRIQIRVLPLLSVESSK